MRAFIATAAICLAFVQLVMAYPDATGYEQQRWNTYPAEEQDEYPAMSDFEVRTIVLDF